MRSGFVAVAFLGAGLAVVGCKSSGGSPGDGGEGGLNANCPAAEDLISDFEVDNSLAPVDGRQGGWYTYGDANGMFLTGGKNGYNIEGSGNPNCSAGGSLHVKGMGFSIYGAATGVDWKPRPLDGDGGYGDKMTYDASKYRGVAFWAKASAQLDGVQVSFPDLYTDGAAPSHDMPDPNNPTGLPLCMAADGSCKCIYNGQSALNCSPYLVQFGLKGDAAADLTFSGYSSFQLDTNWKRFEILFVDTRQDPGNGGYHPPSNTLTVDKLTAMAIQVNADYSTGSAQARDFEIWLDDVSFIK
jgi:hypothetical protein